VSRYDRGLPIGTEYVCDVDYCYNFAAMKHVVYIAFAVFALAQQPSKLPESKEATEGRSAQVSKQADRGENNEPANKRPPSPPPDDQHPPPEVKAATPKANDAEIQGRIKTFTRLLVVVGFLQFAALIGQVVIYCRQAIIMARQAHEMKRQRGYMRLQWRAMQKQVSEMSAQTVVLERSLSIADKSANAAKESADALVTSERPWVTVTLAWSPGYPGLFNRTHIVDGNTTRGYNSTVRMTYKNDGRTPAWITERRACLKITRDMSLPPYPPLEDAEVVKYGPESLAAGEEKSFDTSLTCEGCQTFDNIALVYGIVKYRTAFVGIVGETVFGYDVAFDGKSLRQLENHEWNTNR
jgi:hypothetical protein